MTYFLIKSDGTQLALVSDGTINNLSSSLVWIGKNYPNWGDIFNNNLLHLLENFASPNAPISPITGQLWYKTDDQSLKVYDPVFGWKTVFDYVSNKSFESFQDGTFGSNQTVLKAIMWEPVTFNANFGAYSVAKLDIAPTANTVFSIRKNNVQIGTLTFTTGAQSGAFSLSSETAFAVGDVISVVAPFVPDASAASMSIALVGTVY